ncbi:Phosphate-import permease protein PhnE [Planctomycetes bacterium Pla163]|uniref:Phosphate-import permease protein PhnE n=1 Tax=Rohdeia mirabilis TaxID=2528008 RepID=A0A518CYY5_9BACT|nr:Phosphate-import permease protein PhnE [Planctomycetes bacterium Pla163]
MAPEPPRSEAHGRPRRAPLPPSSSLVRNVGRRLLVTVGLALLALLAFTQLDTPLSGLVPGESGWRIARAFFAQALSPALDYEDPSPGYRPFLVKVALGVWHTILLAAGGMTLAIAVGSVLGLMGASAFWEDREGPRALRSLRLVLFASVRVAIALMRSVHELLWAVVFLAAFGLTPFSAALALSIPYAGTLAKVFSEMLDEEPRQPALALRQLGASRRCELVFGLVPGVLPNAVAYTFYRFECALRSAAVMGFFGLPTLGLDLKLAWFDLHYAEVWTYLYALALMVVVFELWSAGLRRRFVV